MLSANAVTAVRVRIPTGNGFSYCHVRRSNVPAFRPGCITPLVNSPKVGAFECLTRDRGRSAASSSRWTSGCGRARAHCRSAPPCIRFIADSLTYYGEMKMKMRAETTHATEPQVREGMGVRNSNCLFVVTNPTTSRRHTGLLTQGGTGGPVGPLRTLEDPSGPPGPSQGPV